MIPALAAIVCLAFVGYLFWRDQQGPGDQISWAPFAWMFFAGSRFPSSWLNLRAAGSVEAYAEGSPVDRAVFFLLIAWGLFVLYRRPIKWGALLGGNKWLAAYLLYCLLSILWTDEPGVLAKRWLKDLGNPIMALVMLSEVRPYEAIAKTIRRLAYVFLPVSVLFIRYYPEFGRAYSIGGAVSLTGVADQKNTLGLSCLIVGICYGWTFFIKRDRANRYDLAMGVVLMWLLYLADSKTSFACLVVATGIIAFSTRRRTIERPARIMTATLLLTMFYFVADGLFDVRDYILSFLGRDSTLTNRTEVWSIVSALQTNSSVGAGFMTFWSGERMTAVWKALGPGINQAHNGYLEQYLNLGYIGVAFIVGIAAVGLLNVRKQLNVDYQSGVLRLCFIVIAMIYNYTEASFYGINNMWVLLLAASIDPIAAVPAEVLASAGKRGHTPMLALERARRLVAVGRTNSIVDVKRLRPRIRAN
jgi:exopolysaccharide production protein ExoQ